MPSKYVMTSKVRNDETKSRDGVTHKCVIATELNRALPIGI